MLRAAAQLAMKSKMAGVGVFRNSEWLVDRAAAERDASGPCVIVPELPALRNLNLRAGLIQTLAGRDFRNMEQYMCLIGRMLESQPMIIHCSGLSKIQYPRSASAVAEHIESLLRGPSVYHPTRIIMNHVVHQYGSTGNQVHIRPRPRSILGVQPDAGCQWIISRIWHEQHSSILKHRVIRFQTQLLRGFHGLYHSSIQFKIYPTK
ncbi:uncharacterized protein BCR38DRAFT_149086 [Pseudomassariella vexata]|uniref:Uncharacterized protein n=1 Tax=Pseudomassariella vexata TaxID=1141098 RepID=A0A1Y2E6T6_9PEZI|nr:uncharacterized protein BCR38DRAFT_149086 [Pseudomassariella vexata]ORY66996.1 hypothetical protein BCR38DRAFT_149086 [Pseudomassariella vexata]